MSTPIADMVRKMMAAGVAADVVVMAVEAVEMASTKAPEAPKQSASAERMRRYRARRVALGMELNFESGQFRPALKARDGEQCAYCSGADDLVVDHIQPIAQGGTDDIDNLVFACRPCNGGKGGRTPEQANMPFKVQSAHDAHVRYVARTMANSAPNDNPPLILTSLSSKPERDLKEKKVSKRAAPKNRHTIIPAEWHPPDRAHAVAAEIGLTVSDIEPRFRDYLASSGKLYADYDAAFCNFVRNTPKFSGAGKSNGHAPRPGSKDDTRERTVNALRTLDPFPHADEPRPSEGPRAPVSGFLPFAKPS